MKTIFYLMFAVVVLFSACKKQEQNENASDPVEVSENQLLYDEVMKVHDEVMPKMGTVYRKKQDLKQQLDSTGISDDQKKAIQVKIAKLDSAEKGMMDWMHKFKPISDSEGEEEAREYLENEMEKIKKVKEDILTALAEAEKD